MDLFETIQSHIKDFESQLYTSCPAVVDSYNPYDCTVNVFPAIYKAETDGLLIQDQILKRVPLHFQATQELGITFPIRKGDTVLLVFGHSDIENWSNKIEDYVAPKTYRRHNMNDAFAIAGVFKYDKSPVQSGTEEDLNIRYNGSFVRIKANGDVEVNSTGDIKATAGGDVNITASGEITATGTKVIVSGATEVDINSSTKIDLVAPTVTIDADEINFGGTGGAGIARIGDAVQVTHGSSAGTHYITTGSSVGKLL